MLQKETVMHRENVPEYTREEIESFVDATRKYNQAALIGAFIVFIVSALIFTVLLWGILLVIDNEQSRIYAAIGLGVSMVISAVSYWGYVIFPRVEWLISQLQGVGQRVYDTQQKVEDIET